MSKNKIIPKVGWIDTDVEGMKHIFVQWGPEFDNVSDAINDVKENQGHALVEQSGQPAYNKERAK